MTALSRTFTATVVWLCVVACIAEKRDVSVARPEDWRVTEFGLGPVRAGMTVSDASAILVGAGVTVAATKTTDCGYLGLQGAPAGIAMMTEGGRVVRIEVRSGTVATVAGAHIGDTEDRIKSLYPGRVTIGPHKYLANGHYVVVTPASASDSAFRIVFETDSLRVTNYRAGLRPQVDYVERCS